MRRGSRAPAAWLLGRVPRMMTEYHDGFVPRMMINCHDRKFLQLYSSCQQPEPSPFRRALCWWYLVHSLEALCCRGIRLLAPNRFIKCSL